MARTDYQDRTKQHVVANAVKSFSYGSAPTTKSGSRAEEGSQVAIERANTIGLFEKGV